MRIQSVLRTIFLEIICLSIWQNKNYNCIKQVGLNSCYVANVNFHKIQFRSCCSRLSCKKDILKKLLKIHRKTPVLECRHNAFRSGTGVLLGIFEILKNCYFAEHLRTTASLYFRIFLSKGIYKTEMLKSQLFLLQF